jgi:hypothetical protein
MRMDKTIERGGSIAGALLGHARPTGDLAIVCIFSVAGLLLTTLGFALVGFEELAQILPMAG